MKVVVVPNHCNNLYQYTEIGANAFIFGLKDFSVNYPATITIAELTKLMAEMPKSEVFVAINKTIFNQDLQELEAAMIALNQLPIKGVLFYDLAILSLYQKHSFKYDLVWHQTHMVTNYNTCNYYYQKNVKYGVVASELTKEEIIEIQKNTKMKLFVFLIGHPIMAHSKRQLLTNYYRSINKEYDLEDKIIEESDHKYIVKENNLGTCILDGDIVNGIDYVQEFCDNGLEYGIIHGEGLDDLLLKKLIALMRDAVDGNYKESSIEVKKLIGNHSGFFEKKTIFKVKRNEK